MNKVIKINCLNAQKPQNIEEFGYWLAGLIDADGHIEKEGNICVSFHLRDLSVAYYIKKIIEHGSILKLKKSKSYRYWCCRTDKVRWIGDIIRDKLRHVDKIEQFYLRLVPKIGGNKTKNNLNIHFENHWLAGFIQGDGSFQIQINNRPNLKSKTQIMVVIQISQKKDLLLQQIKKAFGGVIYYYKPQDYFFYTSSSIPNAVQFVNYLDNYQVIGSSFKIYQLWRQAHLYMIKKRHLTESGEKSIVDFKTSMSKLKIN